MGIAKLYHGGEECNTYVIGEKGQPCVIVDPGYNAKGCLDDYINRHHKVCLGYLLTHGHYDHIQGLATLTHQAQIFLLEEEKEFLLDSGLNLSQEASNQDLVLERVNTYLLDDQDEVRLGAFLFKVIATPFHTRGSCCYYLEKENALFSGDTLFHLGIGRTDLPTGSEKTVASSLRRLATLPISTKVFPGHGENTTIKNELAFNDAFSNLRGR
jgi:hydroxyacylglutathione hydrolase